MSGKPRIIETDSESELSGFDYWEYFKPNYLKQLEDYPKNYLLTNFAFEIMWFFMKQPTYPTENTIPDESAATDELLIQTIARIDNFALGIAVGTLFGLGIFLATIFLVLKGGEQIGLNLGRLSQYFIGYTVTLAGSFIGLIYGFGVGFIIGWLIAFIRNVAIKIYIFIARFKERMVGVNKFIDFP